MASLPGLVVSAQYHSPVNINAEGGEIERASSDLQIGSFKKLARDRVFAHHPAGTDRAHPESVRLFYARLATDFEVIDPGATGN